MLSSQQTSPTYRVKQKNIQLYHLVTIIATIIKKILWRRMVVTSKAPSLLTEIIDLLKMKVS